MYDYLQWIVDTINAALKHGWSITTFLVALTALLRVRKVKRKLKKLIPMLGDDDSEVKEYVSNQVRIESKLDALLEKEGITWHAEKITSSQNMVRSLSISSWVEKSFVHRVGVFIQKGLTIISRGNRKMKAYLKKLSRTKLQAYLLATIMNIALLVGYVMDIQDIQSKVEAWMPMANMTVQTVLTLIYVWVEGSIDKEQVKAQNPEVKTNEEFNTNTEHFE